MGAQEEHYYQEVESSSALICSTEAELLSVRRRRRVIRMLMLIQMSSRWLSGKSLGPPSFRRRMAGASAGRSPPPDAPSVLTP